MEEATKTLLDTGNEALTVFTKRNLLGEEVDIEEPWTLPQVEMSPAQFPVSSFLSSNVSAEAVL